MLISGVSTTASSSTATSITILKQIQQQIQQQELFTNNLNEQLGFTRALNKQLGLLRDNSSNNATSLPLENVTNLINAVEIVLPSRSNARA